MDITDFRQRWVPRRRRQKNINLFQRHLLVNKTENITWNGKERNSLSTLQGSSLVVLQKHVDIATMVNGKSCTIQGPNSDVKLHVPDGVHGVILTKIHTDHTKFLRFIKTSDCLIGPICEYSLHGNTPPSASKVFRYKLQIPHILKDVRKFRQHIRVRHLNSSSQTTNCNVDLKDEIQFDIDEKYVTIYTSHFSKYIITAEAIHCCASSALAHVFGSLKKDPAVTPLATVNIYLSSTLFQIADYSKNLVEREAMCKNHFLNSGEIHLCSVEYDVTESSIMVTIQPDDSETWKTYKGRKDSVVRPLLAALKYIDGHMCRSYPTQMANFYLVSSKPAVQNFRALIDFKVKATTLSKNSDKSIEQEQDAQLLVDIFEETQKASEKKNKSEKSTQEDECEHELSDSKLIQLSSGLTEIYTLRKLADKLQMNMSDVDKHINNLYKDPGLAAYSVLKDWLRSQENIKVAYGIMCKALQEADVPHLVEKLQ